MDPNNTATAPFDTQVYNVAIQGKQTLTALFDFYYQRSGFSNTIFLISSALLIAAFLRRVITHFTQKSSGIRTPDALPYWIPWLGNAYQYVYHNANFTNYIISKLNGRSIMQFKIGPKKFYFVTGSKNTAAVVRHTGNLAADELFLYATQKVAGATDSDVELFKRDKSGRGLKPLVKIPEDQRIWHLHHRIYMEHLTTGSSVEVMTAKFCEFFQAKLAKFPANEWETLHLFEFLKKHMLESATASMSGTQLLELNPGFSDTFWKFDRRIFTLLYGGGRFLSRSSYDARDAYHDLARKHLQVAEHTYDRHGADAGKDWEPVFGSRFSRESVKFNEKHFSKQSQAGMYVGAIFALNANAIPMATWALIEILRDPKLYADIKKEVITATVPNPEGKQRILDMEKLKKLPLLQSLYVETLRMHVSVNVTREVTDDMKLDGYTLEKGGLVQASSALAHFDESVWGMPEHPASEFWAERHLVDTEVKDEAGNTKTVRQFSLGNKTSSFFPYGGGITTCPGRHFAKQEIMASIALLVSNFEIEFLEYVDKEDGTTSDRPPKDDEWYYGAAAMPPDRDLKIRWKRLEE